MKRIELEQGTTYQVAKLNAATLMLHDPSVNSVRVRTLIRLFKSKGE